jgi:hypothetical protein
LDSRIPEARQQSTLTLSFSFQDFPYHDFGGRNVEQFVSPTLDLLKLQYTREFDFSTPHHLRRDFGRRGITNPDENVSRLLTTKL